MPTLNPTSKVLIAGCGDLGTALAVRLLAQRHQVVTVRRSKIDMGEGIQSMSADVTLPESLQNLAALAPDYLVYCVSAGEQSDEQYRSIYVDGLRNVLNALAPAYSLKHVFFVSSTRVYGQSTSELFDENIPAIACDFGGERLLEGENLLKNLPCSGTVLRFSGIYGASRTRMLRLASNPSLWPTQNSWSNRIHRDDGAAFIAYLIHQLNLGAMLDDCYIVTDCKPTPQYEVLAWLAERLTVDVSHIAYKTAEGGKRLSNARMLATGFIMQYPDYTSGYLEMLNTFKHRD